MVSTVPEYSWKCFSCNAANKAASNSCTQCKCPSNISTRELEEWNKNGHFRPQEPTIFFSLQHGRERSIFLESAPCANCGWLMYVRDDECPKCAHIHDSEEKNKQRNHSKAFKAKGLKFGIIFWSAFVIIVGISLYAKSI